MLKLNLVMNTPSNNEKDNDEVHENTQTNNKELDNDVEIEPAVDLDNPQPRIKDMIKEILLLENTVRKENHGFKNLCPFHPSKLKRKMMKNLNALLKC